MRQLVNERRKRNGLQSHNVLTQLISSVFLCTRRGIKPFLKIPYLQIVLSCLSGDSTSPRSSTLLEFPQLSPAKVFKENRGPFECKHDNSLTIVRQTPVEDSIRFNKAPQKTMEKENQRPYYRP